jgi:hypothetical protein
MVREAGSRRPGYHRDSRRIPTPRVLAFADGNGTGGAHGPHRWLPVRRDPIHFRQRPGRRLPLSLQRLPARHGRPLRELLVGAQRCAAARPWHPAGVRGSQRLRQPRHARALRRLRVAAIQQLASSSGLARDPGGYPGRPQRGASRGCTSGWTARSPGPCPTTGTRDFRRGRAHRAASRCRRPGAGPQNQSSYRPSRSGGWK